MHSLSPRTLAALAFDRGEEYDAGQPISSIVLENLTLVAHATPVTGQEGPVERKRKRKRARERRQQLPAIPDWFSLEDLIGAWERQVIHDELI